MNEGNESFPSTAARKKKRHSGFRYSTRKALERSRKLRRTAIAGIFECTPVSRALSYPSAQTSETCLSDHGTFATGSGGSHLLESVEELHEEWKRMSTSDASIDGDNIQKVSNVNLVSQSKIWHCKRRYF
jgi:hypothetical protein